MSLCQMRSHKVSTSILYHSKAGVCTELLDVPVGLLQGALTVLDNLTKSYTGM